MRRSPHLPLAGFVAAAVAVQVFAVQAGMPYLLTQLTMSAYYTLVVLGLTLLMGYAGQISIGQAGFFAMGGYATAALTTWDLGAHRGSALVASLARAGVLATRPDLYGGEVLVVHSWAAVVSAVALAGGVAFLVGIPVLKLKGHYLAMATLGVGTIILTVVVGSERLGAADGISGVPPFRVLPGVAVHGASSARVANYYVAFGLLALAMLVLLNLVQSRVGRALRAIHGAEEAATAMGVDTASYKIRTFVLSAVLAAVAGAFLTHFNGSIGPSEASVMKSVRYVAIVAVGGMGSLWGTLATSLVLNFLSLRGYFGSFDDAVFGAILVAVMLFAPAGVPGFDVRAGLRAAVVRWRPRAAREPGGVERAAEADALPVHRLDADLPKGGG